MDRHQLRRLLPLAGAGTECRGHSFHPVGVVGRDVEQLPSRPRLPPSDPMDQRGTRGAILESRDDIRVGGAGQLGAPLGEALDVVAQALALHLLAVAQVPGVP